MARGLLDARSGTVGRLTEEGWRDSMTSVTSVSAAQPSLDWDLTDLYADFADPRLAADMELLCQRAAEFRARYHGQVAALAEEPARLAEAIRELEAIQELAGRIVA